MMPTWVEIHTPEVGGYDDAEVLAIHVQEGSLVHAGQTLITLEGTKTMIDVPASVSGVVQTIHVKVGDSVADGSVLMVLNTSNPLSTPPNHLLNQLKKNLRVSLWVSFPCAIMMLILAWHPLTTLQTKYHITSFHPPAFTNLRIADNFSDKKVLFDGQAGETSAACLGVHRLCENQQQKKLTLDSLTLLQTAHAGNAIVQLTFYDEHHHRQVVQNTFQQPQELANQLNRSQKTIPMVVIVIFVIVWLSYLMVCWRLKQKK